MDCVESIALLSEYHDGALGEPSSAQVQEHLLICLECHGVFNDLEVIVTRTRVLLHGGQGITYPDEVMIWRRMNLTRQA